MSRKRKAGFFRRMIQAVRRKWKLADDADDLRALLDKRFHEQQREREEHHHERMLLYDKIAARDEMLTGYREHLRALTEEKRLAGAIHAAELQQITRPKA